MEKMQVNGSERQKNNSGNEEWKAEEQRKKLIGKGNLHYLPDSQSQELNNFKLGPCSPGASLRHHCCNQISVKTVEFFLLLFLSFFFFHF